MRHVQGGEATPVVPAGDSDGKAFPILPAALALLALLAVLAFLARRHLAQKAR